MLDSIKNIDSLSNILADKIENLKKSYNRFKIKSASITKSNKNKKLKPTFKDMVIVNGGKYKPSFFDEEREVFDIEVCKYQVTQDMWKEIMGNPSSNMKGERRPVGRESWWDALEYCNKLSEKYNLDPVYDLSQREEGILRINQLGGDSEYPNMADFRKTEGFRLPTELEWEWFARGGEVAIQDGTFNYEYSGSNEEEEVAWNRDNSGNQIHDVGTKKPNQLGLYDCSGNVWEWCYDTNSSGYISEKIPYIYDATESHRRVRGGSYFYKYKEIGYRFSESADLGAGDTEDVGFRMVRTI